jgi:hypothetical protein
MSSAKGTRSGDIVGIIGLGVSARWTRDLEGEGKLPKINAN